AETVVPVPFEAGGRDGPFCESAVERSEIPARPDAVRLSIRSLATCERETTARFLRASAPRHRRATWLIHRAFAARLTIIIMCTVTVIAAHCSHIHFIEDRPDDICVHAWRMTQRVLHGIDFGRAPLNHEKIGIYEARRRAHVHIRNK